MLKIKDEVIYKDKKEIIKDIFYKINAEMTDYNCMELEIEFESGNFYYDEITDFEYGIDNISERLTKRAELFIQKADLVERVEE